MTVDADLLTDIRDDLAAREGAVVAFSGGVDSSVVAALAHDALGADALAVTATSETLPAAEREIAREVATEIGIEHVHVSFSELEDDAFVENGEERCYHCRSMRLDRLYDVARERGIETVLDGTNASDVGSGHRPGLRAVDELDVYSPLHAHDVEKETVRDIARAYDLSVAEKPSMACLSSRIPSGQRITEDRLSRIERAEAFLREWGFEQFRVRDHDGHARVEVGAHEIERALDPEFAAAATEAILDAGFETVSLDLAGYRSGSVSPDE
ncbi:MAG: ATP-dependent sacrificial sulfur transferase LarE [Halanaeroarchaeum sp.]